MSDTTKIYIVTPCFNSAKTISRTIASVVSQSGDFDIFYHLQDGGSKDETVPIIQRWQRLLNSGTLPISCRSISLTFDSKSDEGMYDAITQAFSQFNPEPNDWMTWINSDDFLVQGAFAYLNAINKNRNLDHIEWITPGAACIAAEGYVTINGSTPRPISGYLAQLGLCDGIHWDFIQQEGTFFRHSLWRKLDIERDFRSFRFAGDWNLWRCLAHHAKPYQSTHALGVFNVMPGQISAASRDKYYAEIDSTVSQAERRRRLELVASQGAEAIFLRTRWNEPSHTIDRQNLKKALEDRISTLGNSKTSSSDPNPIVFGKQYIGLNESWQYPAITEKWAFEKISNGQFPKQDHSLYLGFPWATLIDLIENKRDHQDLINKLSSISKDIRRMHGVARVITTCQHILGSKYFDLMRDHGVTDVFWSHATTSLFGKQVAGVRVHAFPLFPVQTLSQPTPRKRDILFSFAGARSTNWYLSNSRNLIINLLKDDPRGAIVSRDSWHYQNVVYDVQINKTLSTEKNAIDRHRSDEFIDLMSRSIFSLCPSGTGPNSIRLWESIAMGSIPVILSDTHLLPGDRRLWEEAVIFCPESEDAILKLPDQLERLSKDINFLNQKRRALQQLQVLYGTDCFVYDIQKLALTPPLRTENRQAAYNQIADNSSDSPPLSDEVLQDLAFKLIDSDDHEESASLLLRTCGSRMLINPTLFIRQYNSLPRLREACRKALRLVPQKEIEAFQLISQRRGLIV